MAEGVFDGARPGSGFVGFGRPGMAQVMDDDPPIAWRTARVDPGRLTGPTEEPAEERLPDQDSRVVTGEYVICPGGRLNGFDRRQRPGRQHHRPRLPVLRRGPGQRVDPVLPNQVPPQVSG